MERTKYHLISILLFFFAGSLNGSNKGEIYKAYIHNLMPVWKSIIDQLQNQQEKSNEQRLELVNFQYGYIAWCIGNNHKNEAADYLKMAEENLRKLESERFALSKVYGYKSAFYGFHIGLNIFSAPFIGPKSVASAKEAIATDPDDYFGYIQSGNVQFHAPAMFGGSKPEALKSYLKAKALMENNVGGFREDWNYLSLLTSIAKSYEVMNDDVHTKLIYEEILKVEPDFKWVRDELYPELINKNK